MLNSGRSALGRHSPVCRGRVLSDDEHEAVRPLPTKAEGGHRRALSDTTAELGAYKDQGLRRCSTPARTATHPRTQGLAGGYEALLLRGAPAAHGCPALPFVAHIVVYRGGAAVDRAVLPFSAAPVLPGAPWAGRIALPRRGLVLVASSADDSAPGPCAPSTLQIAIRTADGAPLHVFCVRLPDSPPATPVLVVQRKHAHGPGGARVLTAAAVARVAPTRRCPAAIVGAVRVVFALRESHAVSDARDVLCPPKITTTHEVHALGHSPFGPHHVLPVSQIDAPALAALDSSMPSHGDRLFSADESVHFSDNRVHCSDDSVHCSDAKMRKSSDTVHCSDDSVHCSDDRVHTFEFNVHVSDANFAGGNAEKETAECGDCSLADNCPSLVAACADPAMR